MDTADSIVVIGTGPGGAAAADALNAGGYSVTILESGLRPIQAIRVQANGVNVIRKAPAPTSPLPYVALGDPRPAWYHELSPGGLSNHWTGACPRYHPNDFTDGAAAGEEFVWPVRYDDLAPYYLRAERMLRLTGQSQDAACLPGGFRAHEMRIPRAWRRVAGRTGALGSAIVPVPLASGRRWDLSTTPTPFTSWTVVRRLAKRPRVRVLLGHHALRIHTDAHGSASAVEVHNRTTSTRQLIPCAGVVVAAGALATAKLLMDSSTPGNPQGLGNTEGVLGRFVHDHLQHWLVVETDQPMERLSHPLYLTRGPYDETSPMTGTGYVFSARTRERDRMLVHLPTRANRFAFAGFGMTTPLRRNHVALSRDVTDPFGLPALEIRVAFDVQSATRVLEAGRQRILGLLDDSGLGPTLVADVGGFTPGRAVHWAGTARMHASPRFGVCDGFGRVYGTRNVALGDSSVFPTPVEKNPTLTLMALAARSAVSLARDLKGNSR